MTAAPPTSTPNRSGSCAGRSASPKWRTAGGGAVPGALRRPPAARSISRKLERRSSMARSARVSDARVAAGSKGTRRTTDLPVTLSITQTSTESGDRSPTIATTASAPRLAASCSRPARESPGAPAVLSTISVSKPADVSSPFRRTRVSPITGGEFAGRRIITVAARAGVTPAARAAIATNNEIDARMPGASRRTRGAVPLGRAHERPRRPRIGAAGKTPEILFRDRTRSLGSTQLVRQGHLASQRLRGVRARRSAREVDIVPFDRARQPALARLLHAAEAEGGVERTRRIRKAPALGEQRLARQVHAAPGAGGGGGGGQIVAGRAIQRRLDTGAFGLVEDAIEVPRREGRGPAALARRRRRRRPAQ